MRTFVFVSVIALFASLATQAYAQRGGGGPGGCQRGGPTAMPPSTGIPSVITYLPTEGSLSMAGALGSMSNGTASRMQQSYWQQMQQAYLAGQMQQAAQQRQDAAAEKEQERERKIAALKERRAAELAWRAAAKEKLAQRKIAAKK